MLARLLSIFNMSLLHHCRSALSFKSFLLLGALAQFELAVAAPTPGDSSPSPFNAADDGIIKDKSAGLGIELETSDLLLTSKLCTDVAKKNLLKAKTLGGRTGANWELTVDTTISGNTLTAECEFEGDCLVGCFNTRGRAR